MDAAQLVGKWLYRSTEMTFMADGTWEEVTFPYPERVRRAILRGHYWLEEDTLTYETDSSDFPGFPSNPARTFEYPKPRISSKVVQLDAGTLVLQGAARSGGEGKHFEDDDKEVVFRRTLV